MCPLDLIDLGCIWVSRCLKMSLFIFYVKNFWMNTTSCPESQQTQGALSQRTWEKIMIAVTALSNRNCSGGLKTKADYIGVCFSSRIKNDLNKE